MIAWGTGSPRREFLYSDDMAEACIYLMSLPESSFSTLLQGELPPLVNIGCGEDVTIRELVGLVREVVGFRGAIEWDHGKPDGTPRKLLDISRIRSLGWQAEVGLRDGIGLAYRDYQLTVGP